MLEGTFLIHNLFTLKNGNKQKEYVEIMSMNEYKLNKLIGNGKSIREFGDRYEYYIIDEYEKRYEEFTTVEKEIENGELKVINPKDKNYYQEVQILYHRDKNLDEDLNSLVKFAVSTYTQNKTIES